MEHQVKRILLCGSRRTGRSSMIKKLTQQLHVPVCGYRTKTMNKRADGYHEIYMFPYGAETPAVSEACHIGDCNTRQRVIHNEVFDTLGVKLLEPAPGGILVMDEIGFMEAQAEAFCQSVLARLRGETPVLAAVRTSIETPFLRRVVCCEDARVVEMNPERFDEIYEELLPIVLSWEAARGL